MSRVIATHLAGRISVNFDNRRQIAVGHRAASERPVVKVFQLNNWQITQALNDYGVLNEVIES